MKSFFKLKIICVVVFLGLQAILHADAPPLAKGFYPMEQIGSEAENSVGIAVGDVDNDGDLDIAIGNDAQPNRIYLNDGRGHFAFSNRLTSDTYKTRDVQLFDLNKDGYLDILFADGNSSAGGDASNHYCYNNHTGFFGSLFPFENVSGPAYGKTIAAGDIDGNGYNDVVIAYYGRNRVCMDDEVGWFCSDISDDAENTNKILLVDMDKDNDLDVVVANSGTGAYNKVYFNNGSGTFATSTSFGAPDGSYGIAVGDIDGDGDPDVVTGNYSQVNRIYKNDGFGNLSAGEDIGTIVHHTWGVTLADIDNDKDLDILFANGTDPSLLYINDGSGVFTDAMASILDNGYNSYEIAVADIDGDHDMDILTANEANTLNTLMRSRRTQSVLPPIITYLLNDSTVTPPSAPAAPTSVTATAVNQTSDQMHITWHDNANNETGFVIYRSATSDVNSKVQVGTTGANVTTFSDTSLDPCKQYYYWIAAKNTVGETLSSSGNGTTAPAAPTGLTTTQGTSLINIYLQWNMESCAESYNFYRAQSGTDWTFDGTITGGSNSWTFDDDVVLGSTYIYKMVAVKNGAEGAFSNQAMGWVGSAVPKNLVATKGEYYDGIILEWDAVQVCPNTGGVQAKYVNAYGVYYSATQDGTYTWLVDKFVDGVQSNYMYTDSSSARITQTLQMTSDNTSTHYFYKVTSAFRKDANCDGVADDDNTYESTLALSVADEGWKAPTSQPEVTAYLPAPSWVNATDGNACQIRISWGSVPGAEFYRVFRASSAWGPWELQHDTLYDTTVTESVSADLETIVWTGYWYKVVGVNTNGGGYENGNGYANSPEGGYAGRVPPQLCY